MTLKELEELMIFLNHKKFRAKQLYEWIHTKNIDSYSQISNLPSDLISYLEENYPLKSMNITNKCTSSDNSRKYLIETIDKELIETVGIIDSTNSKNRLTVCFSSQIGCPIKCTFCATGKEHFVRNLSTNEIIQQVTLVQKDLNMPVSNLVAMGQGEPFLNYENLINALYRFNQDKGFLIGARKITVSTCGIPEKIIKFANEKEQYRLAISLHSANQSIRNELMPHLSKHTLIDLKEAIQTYQNIKNRRVTLEYLLLNNINDNESDLKNLIAFCEGINVHINLLNYNETPLCSYKPSNNSVYKYWQKELSKAGIVSSLRKSKGADISGACGQLKNSIK